MEFSFAILSRGFWFVKCFFRKLFKFDPQTLAPQPPRSDSFARLPRLSSFVKCFFRFLFEFDFFHLTPPSSRTALLDYHAIPCFVNPLFSLFLPFLENAGDRPFIWYDLWAILKSACANPAVCAILSSMVSAFRRNYVRRSLEECYIRMIKGADFFADTPHDRHLRKAP